MFENIFQTSLPVRVLLIACITIVAVNILAWLISMSLSLYMRVKKIK